MQSAECELSLPPVARHGPARHADRAAPPAQNLGEARDGEKRANVHKGSVDVGGWAGGWEVPDRLPFGRVSDAARWETTRTRDATEHSVRCFRSNPLLIKIYKDPIAP